MEEGLLLETDEGIARYVADVAVEEAGERPMPVSPDGGASRQPVVLTMRRFEPMRAIYLEVLDRHLRRVVTVIEVLSPWNKASGGYEEYLLKRDDLLDGGVNLVEVDLLRGGRRLPTVERLPQGDYFAFVSRGEEPRKAEVYAWGLRDPLPTLPVPLKPADGSVTVPLQPVFDRVYDEAGYRHLLTYREQPKPPLANAVKDWVLERLRAAGVEPPEVG